MIYGAVAASILLVTVPSAFWLFSPIEEVLSGIFLYFVVPLIITNLFTIILLSISFSWSDWALRRCYRRLPQGLHWFVASLLAWSLGVGGLAFLPYLIRRGRRREGVVVAVCAGIILVMAFLCWTISLPSPFMLLLFTVLLSLPLYLAVPHRRALSAWMWGGVAFVLALSVGTNFVMKYMARSEVNRMMAAAMPYFSSSQLPLYDVGDDLVPWVRAAEAWDEASRGLFWIDEGWLAWMERIMPEARHLEGFYEKMLVDGAVRIKLLPTIFFNPQATEPSSGAYMYANLIMYAAVKEDFEAFRHYNTRMKQLRDSYLMSNDNGLFLWAIAAERWRLDAWWRAMASPAIADDDLRRLQEEVVRFEAELKPTYLAVVANTTKRRYDIAGDAYEMGRAFRVAQRFDAEKRIDAALQLSIMLNVDVPGYSIMTYRAVADFARDYNDMIQRGYELEIDDFMREFTQAQYGDNAGYSLVSMAKIIYGVLPHLRVTYLAAAVELFRREHGRVPEELGELVPDYLAELPPWVGVGGIVYEKSAEAMRFEVIWRQYNGKEMRRSFPVEIPAAEEGR